ncbi:ankyrin repeat-containing domain protein, partial [Baffinella frigidus]
LIEADGSIDLNAIDEGGGTALHNAVDEDRDDLVSILLKAGADIEAKDCLGDTPYLRLLTAGVDMEDFTGIFGTLIIAGCNQDASNDDGWTSLFHAASLDMPCTLQMLIDLGGVDIDARSVYGTTALFHS